MNVAKDESPDGKTYDGNPYQGPNLHRIDLASDRRGKQVLYVLPDLHELCAGLDRSALVDLTDGAVSFPAKAKESRRTAHA